MKLYFVRHAEKESEGENPSLTKRGILQAKCLAQRLKKIKFDEFYCSELKRSRQTSEIVSKQIKIKPRVEPSLNEYESSDVKKAKPLWSKEDRVRYKKLIVFLRKLAKDPNQDKSVLIISHGITNRIVMSYFLKIPMKRIIVFRQNETCINLLFWYDKFKNWRVEELNNSSHLQRRLSGHDKR